MKNNNKRYLAFIKIKIVNHQAPNLYEKKLNDICLCFSPYSRHPDVIVDWPHHTSKPHFHFWNADTSIKATKEKKIRTSDRNVFCWLENSLLIMKSTKSQKVHSKQEALCWVCLCMHLAINTFHVLDTELFLHFCYRKKLRSIYCLN